MAGLVAQLPPFDPDATVGASLAPRWKTWVSDFTTYLVANAIDNNKRKRALLLYLAGSRVREIFRHLTDTGGDEDFDTALTALTKYFEPHRNRLYEVYTFRQAFQEPTETIDQYHTRLRGLAENCEFADADFEIIMQIVLHGTSSHLRKQALKNPSIKLSDLLLAGRQEEISRFQASHIESKTTEAPEDVNFVRKRDKHKAAFSRKTAQTCRNCGGEWPHANAVCPAKGKSCRACGKSNHFANQCRSQRRPRNKGSHVKPLKVNYNSGSESEQDYCYAISHVPKKHPKANVLVNGISMRFLVDTGSSINVIDYGTFQKLPNITLKRTTIKAYPFNSNEPVKMKGKFDTTIESQNKFAVATIYVTEDDGGCLLSAETAQDLGLVRFHLDALQEDKMRTNTSPDHVLKDLKNPQDPKITAILTKHQELFHGLGKLKNKEIELCVDRAIPPVAQQQRRIPFHLREKVELELKHLEAQDIIEKVPANEQTDWVSPIVVVPKKEQAIRICVDMRAANTAIKRFRHPIPTVKDISLALNGAQYFTKLDMSQAYHQLPLHARSRHITTFATHMGLYRYKRLNYGTNSAAEIFQHTLQQLLKGIPGVCNLADDILVFAPSYEEHNKALEACFQRLQDHGLTLNLRKCKFLKRNLEFFGFLFTKDGTKPDPMKVDAFINTPRPTNVSELRSLLGMSNYSSQYIRDYATLTEPLRRLTHKDTQFVWGAAQEEAYQTLKTALLSSPVMSYFDINKETAILVDASPVGLSAILSQRKHGSNNSQIIAYASRSLSQTEQRYSQTEKEALAIVWGIEHFHLYIYGAPFVLYTDHKPLELIYENPMSKPPARIERWMLRLQEYDFKVVYKSGADNPADFLSRHPQEYTTKTQSEAEEYVNFLVYTAVPQSMTLQEVANETQKDHTLRAVRAALRTGYWNSDSVQGYKQIRHEITIDDNNHILLRGSRIILPSSLQARAVTLAHEGHQGQAKTTALLRECVWFPGIGQRVKEEVGKCIACQATSQPNPPEPLCSAPMPSHAWNELKIDFCGPFPSGHYILVVIDVYSRYPEIEILKSIAAPKVIPKLDVIFARHGIPEQITTDNGPPFNGNEFRTYMKELGIKHSPSTPLWPQGNAEAESFNKPLEKAIRAAHIDRRPWQQELAKFLLNYRSTPHSTTKVPPAAMLFNRQIKGKLPVLQNRMKVVDRHHEARNNQQASKQKSREYANAHRRTKQSNFQVGDTVLVKVPKANKLSTNFDPLPYEITEIKGTRITAKRNGHYIVRNVSFFKKIAVEHMADSDDDEYMTSKKTLPEKQGVEKQPLRRSTRMKTRTQFYGQPVTLNITS